MCYNILCKYKNLLQKGWKKMIKFIMRKTIYKGVDFETQNLLLQLFYAQSLIMILCCITITCFFILPFIPLVIIDICEDTELALTTQFAIYGFMLVCFVGILLFINFFRKPLIIFFQLIFEKVCFEICTKKGNALLKKDFETIKNNDDVLYDFISSQKCQGYCYSICFEILKALEKGYIEFIAIKKFSFPPTDKDDDGRKFSLHVLYCNNGWAFDTVSQRQYPIEKLHKIYSAKICKTFDFDDIKSKSFEDFRDENDSYLVEWCYNNDCSLFSHEE